MAILLPWSDPAIVDTTQIGPPITGLWSDPSVVSTLRPTAPWSTVIGGEFVSFGASFD